MDTKHETFFNSSSQCSLTKEQTNYKMLPTSPAGYNFLTSANNNNNIAFGLGRLLRAAFIKTTEIFSYYWYPKETGKSKRSELQKLRYDRYIFDLDEAIRMAKENPHDISKINTVIKVISDYFKERSLFDRDQLVKQSAELREKIKNTFDIEKQAFLFDKLKNAFSLISNHLSDEEIENFQKEEIKKITITLDSTVQANFAQMSDPSDLKAILPLKKDIREAQAILKKVIGESITTRTNRDLLLDTEKKLTIAVRPTLTDRIDGGYEPEDHIVTINFVYPLSSTFRSHKEQYKYFYHTLLNELFSAALKRTNDKKSINFFPFPSKKNTPPDEKAFAVMSHKLHNAVERANQRMERLRAILEKKTRLQNLSDKEEKQLTEAETALKYFKHNFNPTTTPEPRTPDELLNYYLTEWKILKTFVSENKPYANLSQAGRDHEYASFFEALPSEAKEYFFSELCDLLSEFHEVEKYCGHENPSFMMK